MNILDVCSTLPIRSGKTAGVDFIGKGNLWINNTYNASVNHLARYVLSEAIFQTAPGQLSVLGYDGSLSAYLPLLPRFPQGNPEFWNSSRTKNS